LLAVNNKACVYLLLVLMTCILDWTILFLYFMPKWTVR